MTVNYEYIGFDSGRRFGCKQEMFQISENGYLKVVGEDHVIQSHQLSLKEMSEMREYLQEQIELLNQFINNPLE